MCTNSIMFVISGSVSVHRSFSLLQIIFSCFFAYFVIFDGCQTILPSWVLDTFVFPLNIIELCFGVWLSYQFDTFQSSFNIC